MSSAVILTGSRLVMSSMGVSWGPAGPMASQRLYALIPYSATWGEPPARQELLCLPPLIGNSPHRSGADVRPGINVPPTRTQHQQQLVCGWAEIGIPDADD